MMEIKLLDAVDAVIVTPVFAGAVGASHGQSMQDGQTLLRHFRRRTLLFSVAYA
jgi:hypothetical protein